MNIPSLIFWAVFVLPLVVFLIWLMRQDKRKGAAGLIFLAILVVGAIVYTYLTDDQANRQKEEQSGTVSPHKDS